MKLKTLVVAGGAVAIGYLLGTKAGRARFEEIKAKAGEIAHDPRVRSGVSSVAGEVRKNADKLPPNVSGIVREAATRVEDATREHTDPSVTTQ